LADATSSDSAARSTVSIGAMMSVTPLACRTRPPAVDWRFRRPRPAATMDGMSVDVEVISVFVDENGRYGNELGIVTSTEASRGREQPIATLLGFSETVFIDAATTPAASMRIFTPAAELPFAGHPSVGTAWWLRRQGTTVDRLLVPAGEVGVRFDGDLTWISARPAWAPEFTWSELDSADELAALDPDRFTDGHTYAYVWLDRAAGRVAARMFAPAMGIREDEATGAAAIRVTDRLGRDLSITQGRGSQLRTRRLPEGLVEVGGRCRYERRTSVAV
jgi:predicted PhzF superfamily epimerase YddE/YHI9